MGTKSAWTAERRAKQRAIIAKTKPWERSTGPTSIEGKAKSSQNARLPEGLAAARARRAEIREVALDLFGKKRMPKWPL